ncbi:MAG: hypothetical protein GXP47_15125 [Acidobacteria bacterium]|nr:hypothetical protein [Acidobacteriota bacterium]
MVRRSTVRVIVHGKAAVCPEIHRAVEMLRRHGHTVAVRVTRGGGDAALFAVEAATHRIDTVVAGAGDGRQASGGHVVCPGVLIDDGLADLRILPDVQPEEMPTALQRVVPDGFAAPESVIASSRPSSV